MEPPDTRYAWNEDVALAYQTVGQGPVDLLYLQGWISHVELNWGSSHLAAFLRELSSVGKLIMVDRRGWGLSDRFSPSDVPPMETLIEDLGVVLDATGIRRMVLVSSCECATISLLFVATHPERIQGLVLIDPWVSYVATEETPWMWSPSTVDEIAAEIRTQYPLQQWVAGVGDREGGSPALRGMRPHPERSSQSSGGSLRQTCETCSRSSKSRHWSSVTLMERTTTTPEGRSSSQSGSLGQGSSSCRAELIQVQDGSIGTSDVMASFARSVSS
jgi:pimeloyl-ACP methyl ester carboxylesterase